MRIKTVIFFLILNLNIYPSNAGEITEDFNEANSLILIGELNKAKDILSKILKKNPKNSQIMNNIAFIEAKSGNIDKAIKILRGQISENENIETIYKNLTNLYAFQANLLYEEALSIQESENEIELSLIKKLKTADNNIANKKISPEKKEVRVLKNIAQENIKPENIELFIVNWANYWQNKKYDEYFNCYEENYFPKNFKSKSAWKSDRKEKIQNKKNITIKISDINLINYDTKNILIQFTQAYNSDSFSDVVKKHTTATIVNGDIKITGEYILK